MSLYKLPNGTKVREGTAFTLDEIRYPENWLQLATAEDLSRRGIVGIAEATRPDERFCTITENEDGTLNITPRDLTAKKVELVVGVKHIAGNILSQTDWKVIRSREIGLPIDQATLDYRHSIRATSDAHEASINACADIDQLAALACDWPKAPWDKLIP